VRADRICARPRGSGVYGRAAAHAALCIASVERSFRLHAMCRSVIEDASQAVRACQMTVSADRWCTSRKLASGASVPCLRLHEHYRMLWLLETDAAMHCSVSVSVCIAASGSCGSSDSAVRRDRRVFVLSPHAACALSNAAPLGSGSGELSLALDTSGKCPYSAAQQRAVVMRTGAAVPYLKALE
jgi:hypothetical protein